MSRSEPKRHKDTDGAQQDDQRIRAFVAEDSSGGRYVIGEGVDADAPQLDLVGDAQGRVCLFEPATSETGTTGSWIEVDEEVLVPLEADDG